MFGILASAVTFTGCSDDGGDGDGDGNSGLSAGELVMTQDGNELSFTNVQGSTPSFNYQKTVIIASSGNQQLTITCNDTAAGTYAVDLGNLETAGNYASIVYSPDVSVSNSNFFTATSGTVTLSNVTGSTVSGTFSFNGTNQGQNTVVTGGEFNEIPL